jgi:hypothetical protein
MIIYVPVKSGPQGSIKLWENQKNIGRAAGALPTKGFEWLCQ